MHFIVSVILCLYSLLKHMKKINKIQKKINPVFVFTTCRVGFFNFILTFVFFFYII